MTSQPSLALRRSFLSSSSWETWSRMCCWRFSTRESSTRHEHVESHYPGGCYRRADRWSPGGTIGRLLEAIVDAAAARSLCSDLRGNPRGAWSPVISCAGDLGSRYALWPQQSGSNAYLRPGKYCALAWP